MSMLAIFTWPCPSKLILQFDPNYSNILKTFYTKFLLLFSIGWWIPQTRTSISICRSWSPNGKFYRLNQREIKFAERKLSKFQSHFSSSLFRGPKYITTKYFFLAWNIMSNIFVLFCSFVYLLKIFLVQSVGCFWPHSCCRVLCIISPSYLPPSIRKYLNKIETKTITQFVSPWEPGTMK